MLFYFAGSLELLNKIKGGRLKRSFFVYAPVIVFLCLLNFSPADTITLLTNNLAFPLILPFLFFKVFKTDSLLSYFTRFKSAILVLVVLLVVLEFFVFKKSFLAQQFLFLLLFYCSLENDKASSLFGYLVLILVAMLFVVTDARTHLIVVFLAFFFTIAFKFVGNRLVKLMVFAGIFLSILLPILLPLLSFEEFLNTDLISLKNTRGFLTLELVNDFDSLKDWLHGRGFMGTYYSHWFRIWNGPIDDSYIRFSIEIGHLQLILKGGLLLWLIYIYPIVKSMLIRINSGDDMALRQVAILLSFFISLGISFYPSLDLNFMIIWMIVNMSLQHEK